MTARQKSPWIQVGAAGKRVALPNLGAIDFSHIELEDLIPALSRQCRFNGHCAIFYSVLEHCCLVSALAPVGFKREALLHDLAESITGDVITPLKRAGGKGPVMARIETALARRFAFQWPSSREVHRADSYALRIEYQHLLPHTEPWEGMDLTLPPSIPAIMGSYLGHNSQQAETLWWDMWADALVDG
jgi:hypothetical protein